MFPFWNHTWTQVKQKLCRMKTFLPVQSTNKHLILKKLDNQILTEERIDNYAITKLPNETIKMILVDTVNASKNSTETYAILSQTCSRFNDILKRKQDKLLIHIHMKFLNSVYDSLPGFHNKIKVTVPKITKKFGPNSRVATDLFEIVDDKKWKSAWIVINPGKHLWYIIERHYYKLNGNSILFEDKKDKLYCLKNDPYKLHFKGKEIAFTKINPPEFLSKWPSVRKNKLRKIQFSKKWIL